MVDALDGNLSGTIWTLILIWPPIAILILRSTVVGVILASLATITIITTAALQLNDLLPTVLDQPRDIFLLSVGMQIIAMIVLVVVNAVISIREQRALAEMHQAQHDLSLQLARVQGLLAEQDRLNTELRSTLEDNQRQREIIREVGAPLLPVQNNTLVMPLVGEFDRRRLADAEARALESLAQTRAQRLLIDLTGLAIVTADVAEGLAELVQAAQLLGTRVALVGVRPEAALTLIQYPMHTVPTFRDLQSALS